MTIQNVADIRRAILTLCVELVLGASCVFVLTLILICAMRQH
jgi:hypothetical protein